VGCDAAEVSELEVETALAARKLDACGRNQSISAGSGSILDCLIVLGTKTVQTIDAAVELVGNL